MQKVLSIGIVGAGVAGSRCAQLLAAAGHSVTVWDKARGPGGRLATRLARWTDAQGQSRVTAFDHGASSFVAQTPSFLQGFIAEGLADGWLHRWTPVQQGDEAGAAAASAPAAWLPASPQPRVCQQLLSGATLHTGEAVRALQRDAGGWRLQVGDAWTPAAAPFDALLLALPPAQVEPLAAPHHSSWARQAALVPMQPCWTLMAVSDALQREPRWAEASPHQGPLMQVLQQQARPGRVAVPGEAHWVVHASAAWSREHLEADPAWVQAQMQQALAAHLGEAMAWRYATVHRWRYAQCATPARHPLQPSPRAWWCAQRRLGVCGDWLGGGGVEGAWLSGDTLAHALLCSDSPSDLEHAGRAARVLF